MIPLSSAELNLRSTELRAAGWVIDRDATALLQTYKFANFPAAMAFMALVAPVAEAADHHPEWSNVYNRVEVRLTTHDAGGVTEKDIKLAQHMESIYLTLASRMNAQALR